MEPSPALRELHDAILRQDPALAARRPRPATARDRQRCPPVVGGGERAVAVAAVGLVGGVVGA